LRNIILGRVNAGIRRAKEKGKILGRPKSLNLDVMELEKMRKRGMSFRQIARQKNVSVRSVFKSLPKPSPADR
jgi:DNA invertase Pin-like site-specific DNA recombinase